MKSKFLKKIEKENRKSVYLNLSIKNDSSERVSIDPISLESSK
jgi:hypothetical protein